MIAICGAGIAGLTLANALEQRGEEYLVLERSATVRTDGAGLVLHHNALSVLEALGVAEGLPGVRLSSFQMFMGSRKQTLPFTHIGASRALAVHRQDVMQALLAQLPKTRIRCNTDVESLQHGKTKLAIRTSQEVLHPHIVVAANGQASQLHNAAHINTTRQWCWRTVVPRSDTDTIGLEHWLGRHRFGIIPISEHKAYVFHVVQDANDNDTASHLQWLHEQQARGHFGNLDFTNAQWLSHPINERRIDWGNNNCVAIGDAAHAMTPNMGQGAAMAMEDAWVLAELITSGTAPESLARQLAERRHKRVRAVQRQSRQIGQMAHWQNKALCIVRNNVIGSVPSTLVACQQQQQMLAFTEHHKLRTQ